MTTLTAPRHVLRVADLSAGELERVLDLAARMKADPGGWTGALPGRALACLFEKPSTRTRASLAVAAHRLGMLPLVLRPDELQLGRGETIADTARVLSGYAAAITVRTFAQATLEELADHATVPVINALSDAHHPCQALADLLTMRERFGTLPGLRLAYVGDANNVAHSLLEAGALAGVSVALACPRGYEPDDEVLDRAFHLQADHGGLLEVTHDPRHAVAGAHAVYTDVWVSMGEDAERDQRLAALEPYRVTRALMSAADPQAIFLHCLPAHRGEEVDAAVIDGAQSAVWQQAANRLPTEQALIYALITGDWDGSA
ncbi:MAG TPA: ornithine carbamoyltransferase [Solirubrobacteraceae bacterium]|nr:ornithine carbamoyltransferase [Solirubrobacteraceae bacterium]